MPSTVRTRLTAAERSEQLVGAAVKAFAAHGYAGTTTDEVARLAGVSQPYVIRLFGTKQKLFVAAVEHACGRIEQAFRGAAKRGRGEGTADGEDTEQADLASLAAAYGNLLEERELLTVLLHGYAASSDPAIGSVVRGRYGRIYQVIKELTGQPPEQVRAFLATGMLLTVLAAMGIVGPDPVAQEPWMTEIIDSLGEDTRPPSSS
jgi:AcrR family transcriptional regulator